MVADNQSEGITDLLEPLETTLAKVAEPWEPADAARKLVLTQAADEIFRYAQERDQVSLTFICTHNSRRSHLSQVWASVAAAYFHFRSVAFTTYSGGTEATACNERTVRAFRRAGFSVINSDDSENPIYLLQFRESALPMKLFSKVYDQEGNPDKDYVAVMTCDHADANCPIVRGAGARVSLPFIDPKSSDNSPSESEIYSARLIEIGREIFYVFRLVKRHFDN